jgi:membrane associated rhomboid family serine protease
MRGDGADMRLVMPKPGRGLVVVMIGLLAIWLAFALGINWFGASSHVFLLLCGSTALVLHGQVWRLVTAPFMHVPSGDIWHIVTVELGLYFLSPSLEESWGEARFLRFLAMSAVFAYAVQMAIVLALPASLGAKLTPSYWFGAMPVVEAVAIAWALSFKGRTVNLMFILPVSSTVLILFVIGISVLMLIAGAMPPEGLIAPFGGMLAGWIFGGSTPSPARRLWLKLKLRRLNREALRDQRALRQRRRSSNLRVIEGGTDRNEDEKSNGSNGDDRRGPDGRWLN